MRCGHRFSVLAWLVTLPLAVCAQSVESDGSPSSSPKSPLRSSLLFFDDFSNYTGAPDTFRWEYSGAWVNRGFDPCPPTVGMVTLDALDARGRLYPQASTGSFAADTLCSRAIRLDSLFGEHPRAITREDTVSLSFYYLPGGGSGYMWQRIGRCPDRGDSLVLEFWNATADRWEWQWATEGVPVDSLVARTGCRWQYVSIVVSGSGFFSKGFRFRFRNYCSLDDDSDFGYVGNCDQWMIDAVSLSLGSSGSFPDYVRDITFVSDAPSFLSSCHAMPASQFRPEDMANSVNLVISNRYSHPVATQYSYTVSRENGGLIASYDGGYANTPTFYPDGLYQEYAPHTIPPVGFVFPVSENGDAFVIRHVLTEGVGGDDYHENDTLTFIQRFADYYAYDDGSAESGYGVISPNARFAMQFRLNHADTLAAVEIFFNDTKEGENLEIPFRLAVWDDHDGYPGNMIYCDECQRYPDYDAIHSFRRYSLEHPVAVSGRIYVGIVQQSEGYLNIGFDQNNDSHDRTFYSVSNSWQRTVLYGTVMLRPCLTGSVHSNAIREDSRHGAAFRLYPNPASGGFRIECDNASSECYMLTVADMYGRTLCSALVEADGGTVVNTERWAQGLYLVSLSDEHGVVVSTKRIQIVH